MNITATLTCNKLEPLTVTIGGTALLIEGRRIAHASSRSVARMIANAMGITCDRWIELNLYVTKDRNFIAQRIHCTIRDSEQTTYEGMVCDDLNQAVEFFGRDWLAKELFENCCIDLTS
jgi:hypothetical protein